MVKYKNAQVSFRCPSEVRDMFNRLYPFLISRFLIRCLIKACNDSKFFSDVFFSVDDSPYYERKSRYTIERSE